MAVVPVLVLPHPHLKQPTRPITEIGDSERVLAAMLLETMRESPACVGLAANQIGDDRRAFCVDVTGHRKADSCHGQFVMFNPELLEASDPEPAREGCLSVPDLTGTVMRATQVTIRGLSLESEEVTLEANAFEARAILHELDHLEGLLFLDRVSSLTSDVFRRKRYQ